MRKPGSGWYRLFIAVMVILLVLGIWALITGIDESRYIPQPHRIMPPYWGGSIGFAV